MGTSYTQHGNDNVQVDKQNIIINPKYEPELILIYFDETILKTVAFFAATLMLIAAFILKDTLSYLPWLFLVILIGFNIICLNHKNMFAYKDEDFILINKNKYKASDISDFRILNHRVTLKLPQKEELSIIFIFKKDAIALKNWYDHHTLNKEK